MYGGGVHHTINSSEVPLVTYDFLANNVTDGFACPSVTKSKDLWKETLEDLMSCVNTWQNNSIVRSGNVNTAVSSVIGAESLITQHQRLPPAQYFPDQLLQAQNQQPIHGSILNPLQPPMQCTADTQTQHHHQMSVNVQSSSPDTLYTERISQVEDKMQLPLSDQAQVQGVMTSPTHRQAPLQHPPRQLLSDPTNRIRRHMAPQQLPQSMHMAHMQHLAQTRNHMIPQLHPNAHMGIPMKRHAHMYDERNSQGSYRRVGTMASRAMMAPAYPGYEIGPPTNANANPNPNANAYGDRKVFSPNGWEKMHSVGSMPRSMESNGIHENAAFMYNNCIPPVLPDGDDGSMAPRLVYLGSLENLGDERLSDSEENPFLNAGTDVGRKAVITPRDILVYGRRDSFCLGDSPFSMKGDPRAARMLKDASLNSQINHIRATTNRPPRQQKEKNQKQPDLETYAQLAADMDKIRGVCYCRSDNSWTAWWSEKGRNRKKAFKVSRFGFYEARRMAVDHRAGVTHKPASALERRALKHDDNYEAPISDPGTELAAVRETSEASNNNELSPTTLPIQALPAPPRMETRSQHGEAFQLLETEDDVSPLSSKDSTAGNTVITEFAVGNSVTPRVALDLDPNLSSEDDSYSVMDKRRPPSEQPDVKETESVWGDSQSSGLFEERRKRKRLSSATTPERPECTEADAMEPTPTEVTLNRELLNGLKLDESTVRDVELAISNMTSDVSSVRMSGCRTVQVHPKVASMPGGDKLSVLLIRHA